MTKEELIANLATCHSGDIEVDHGRADDFLLAYINDPEITEAFDLIEKWYA
jgi:hypothetical protein